MKLKDLNEMLKIGNNKRIDVSKTIVMERNKHGMKILKFSIEFSPLNITFDLSYSLICNTLIR